MHIQESSSLKSIDLMLPYTQVWVIKRSLNFKPYNAHRAIGKKFKGSCVDLKFICLIWLSVSQKACGSILSNFQVKGYSLVCIKNFNSVYGLYRRSIGKKPKRIDLSILVVWMCGFAMWIGMAVVTDWIWQMSEHVWFRPVQFDRFFNLPHAT